MRVATNAARGPVAPTPTPCPNRVGSTRTHHRCWTRNSGLDTYNADGSRKSQKLTAPLLGAAGANLGTTTLATTRMTYNQSGQLTSYEGAPATATWDAANALGNGLVSTIAGLQGTTAPPSLDLDLHLDYTYDGLGRLAGLTYDTSVGNTPGIVSDSLHDFLLGPGGIPIAQTTSLNVVNLVVGGYLTEGVAVDGTKINTAFATELSKVPPLVLHTDQLGSTRLVTTTKTVSANTVLVPLLAMDYNAYGATTTTVLHNLTGIAPSSILVPLQYAGYYTDLASGLAYLGNRWYDPYTSQFITQDPALAATAQPYAYTGGDPLTYTDPFGLCVKGFGWFCNNLDKASNAVYDGVNAVGRYVSNPENLGTVVGGAAVVAYGFCWAGGSGCAVGAGLSFLSVALDGKGVWDGCVANYQTADCASSALSLAIDGFTARKAEALVWSGRHVSEYFRATSLYGWNSVIGAGTTTFGALSSTAIHAFC